MTSSELDKLQQTNKIPEITVDLINDKYIRITAKQMDTARYLLVTVTEDGIKKVFQNPQEADVRIRKPDGHAVLNEPVLIEDGRLLIELTEQILAVSGCAEMELSFTDKVTGKIYSTKTIHMDIVSQVYPNDNIISSYEFDKLNQQREHLVEIENQTTEAETIRKQNENIRDENESIRIANENIRKQNEIIRNENETTRIANENRRQEAEATRILNEEKRIQAINSAISNHNTSVNSHNDIRELINVLDTRLNTLADSDDETLDQLSEIVTYIKSNRDLIENVTINKVNVSDIINHLNSIEVNKPLSANQGKILKDFIDNIVIALRDNLDISNINVPIDFYGLGHPNDFGYEASEAYNGKYYLDVIGRDLYQCGWNGSGQNYIWKYFDIHPMLKTYRLQSEIDVNRNKITALEQQITTIPTTTELAKYAKSTDLAATKEEINNSVANTYITKTMSDSNIATAKTAAIDSANATTDTKLKNYATTTQLANTNTTLTTVSNRVTALETSGELFANNIYTDTSPFNIIDKSVNNKKIISLTHGWSTDSNVISQYIGISTNWDGFFIDSPVDFDKTTLFYERANFNSGIGIDYDNFVIMPTPSSTNNLGFYNYAGGTCFYFNKPISLTAPDATANNSFAVSAAWYRARFNTTQFDPNVSGNVTLKTISGRTNLCSVGSHMSPTGVDYIRAANNNFMITGEWNNAGTFTTRSIAAPSSDVRLKTNIKPTKVNALDIINQIEMVEFDWKDRKENEHWDIGMIADAIEQIDSNLTFGGGYDEEGIMNVKSVNDFYLLGYCVKAIQELSAENKMLHEEINILKETMEAI